jgi:hypothetical protein
MPGTGVGESPTHIGGIAIFQIVQRPIVAVVGEGHTVDICRRRNSVWRNTMSTTSEIARLKGHLSAQRQAISALATATRRLHRTMERIITAAEVRNGAATNGWPMKGPKQKNSIGFVAPPASPKRAKAAKSRPADRLPQASLERHWGNLF